jgi:3-deoxy-D-manno-octulosonic-acid transferase
LALGPGKLAESVKGRRGAADRWATWARATRPENALVWFHAASVGEAQTAAPVIARLRRARPDLTPIITASSPTLARWPKRFGAAHLDYVPLDEPDSVTHALEALRPSVLVFSRGDLWPELIAQTHGRGIPVAVIAAHLRPSSRRLHWPARRLYARLLPWLRFIGAVSTGDATRWQLLGASDRAITVTGDPRHDAVLERPTALERLQPLLEWSHGRKVLVAGSVEPPDEDVLLHAFRIVLDRDGSAGMLLAPHEPTGDTVARLHHKAARLRIPMGIWGNDRTGPTASCLVADALGLLFDLYVLADLAYVGGGLRPRRLHAVIEPAAYGLPIMFGPHWSEFPDAAAIHAAGGATVVSATEPASTLAGASRSRSRRPACAPRRSGTAHDEGPAGHSLEAGRRCLLDDSAGNESGNPDSEVQAGTECNGLDRRAVEID